MPEKISISVNRLPQKSETDSFVAPDDEGFFSFDDNYGDTHVVTRKPTKRDVEVNEEARLAVAQEALVNAGIKNVELHIGSGNGISAEIFGVVLQGNITGLLGTIRHEADEERHAKGGVIHRNREFSDAEIVAAVRDLLKKTYDQLSDLL